MKITKKLMIMAVVITLTVNLFAGMTVFAGDADIIKTSELSGLSKTMTDADDVQIISLDVTIPENTKAGYAFKFINGDGDTTPYGNLRFRASGKIALNTKAADWAAPWLEADNYNRKAYTLGKTHELIFRLSKNTGNVDFYLDGAYFFRQTGTGSTWIWGITVATDTTNTNDDGSYIMPTVKVNYVMGLSDDEVGAFLSSIDEENKTITIEFTENVSGTLESAKLRRVNGGTEIALSNPVASENTLTYTYADELEIGEEYVFIPGDAIKGTKYDYAVENAYFSMDSRKSSTIHLSTFEDDDTAALSIKDQSTDVTGIGTIVDGGKGSDKGLKVTSVYGFEDDTYTTSNLTFEGLKYPSTATSDMKAFSFDIKPLVDNLGISAIFLKDSTSTQKNTAMGISSKTQELYGIAKDQWAGDIEKTLGETDNWGNGYRLKQNDAVLKATKDEWINFRIEYDTRTKYGAFYINGVQANTATAGKDICNTQADNLVSMAFYVYLSRMGLSITDETGTDLFVLDNVKTESIERPINVSNVRFTEANGDTAGAYDTLDSSLNSVAVTFSDAMTLGETSDNIKLYYGDTEIAYTGVYDEETKCYTMTPSVQADLPGKDYKVVVEGITATSGATVEDYTCLVSTDMDTFIDAAVEVVNASDEAVTEIEPGAIYTIKCDYSSSASGMASASVLIAEYSADGAIANVILESISEAKDISYTIDVDAEAYPEKVRVFVWSGMNTLIPLCDSVDLSVITE